MKKFPLMLGFLLCTSILFAQDDSKTVIQKRKVMNGAELKKMFGDITDHNIYDSAGRIVDSADAVKMLKTFEYEMSFARKNGNTEFKRVISRINPIKQEAMDANTRAMLRPKNIKVQEGAILDIRPLTKRIDRKKLEGKVILMIFWCDGCYGGSDAFADINEVVSKYMIPENLQVLAITHHPVEIVKSALEKNPIVNTELLIDAGELTQAYETENRPLLLLTDKSHKILYSIANGNAGMTPRVLNQLLKKSL